MQANALNRYSTSSSEDSREDRIEILSTRTGRVIGFLSKEQRKRVLEGWRVLYFDKEAGEVICLDRNNMRQETGDQMW